MIHNSTRCLTLARRAMVCEAAEASTSLAARGDGSPDPVSEGAPRRPIRTGSDQRRAQFADPVSVAARERARKCLAGECGECRETPMVCLGEVDGAPCPARLHGVRCAQITKGHAALGCFRGTSCRLRRLSPDTRLSDFPEEAVRVAEETMLLELSSGAEATGGRTTTSLSFSVSS